MFGEPRKGVEESIEQLRNFISAKIIVYSEESPLLVRSVAGIDDKKKRAKKFWDGIVGIIAGPYIMQSDCISIPMHRPHQLTRQLFVRSRFVDAYFALWRVWCNHACPFFCRNRLIEPMTPNGYKYEMVILHNSTKVNTLVDNFLTFGMQAGLDDFCHHIVDVWLHGEKSVVDPPLVREQLLTQKASAYVNAWYEKATLPKNHNGKLWPGVDAYIKMSNNTPGGALNMHDLTRSMLHSVFNTRFATYNNFLRQVTDRGERDLEEFVVVLAADVHETHPRSPKEVKDTSIVHEVLGDAFWSRPNACGGVYVFPSRPLCCARLITVCSALNPSYYLRQYPNTDKEELKGYAGFSIPDDCLFLKKSDVKVSALKNLENALTKDGCERITHSPGHEVTLPSTFVMTNGDAFRDLCNGHTSYQP